jgi:hypothetical protein
VPPIRLGRSPRPKDRTLHSRHSSHELIRAEIRNLKRAPIR